MAKPLTYAQYIGALRGVGLKVVEVQTDGKSPALHNRNHMGDWGPVHGIMLHHTVTKGAANTVEICRRGYAGLPGPLCQGVITKDGAIHVVGYGRANHAGMGDGDVLRAVINETTLPLDNQANTDGNKHFYGFECENLGDGKDPWTKAQVASMVLASAAICRAHTKLDPENPWTAKSVIAHAEWQPGKIDPRPHAGADVWTDVRMPALRSRIGSELKVTPKPPTPPAPAPALTLESLAKRVAALEAKLK
ncbi:peptidoglycan-binding protein [Streptomyces agglomeratus]|uniref:Peptidoglycan-binding protein n=1 Tax=Streptomyces agglomeratus TaxID=285458 RepID=A0A1E5P403_9ACTN|nr:peptidoglycan-binding protein [Streptomyces agglomeratus]